MLRCRALESFETEWYERKAAGKRPAGPANVPDVYSHNAVRGQRVLAQPPRAAWQSRLLRACERLWLRRAWQRPCPIAAGTHTTPQELEADAAHLAQELASAQQLAATASGTWEQLRKERDFHRLHHKRVAQVRRGGGSWQPAAGS
jgi:hypothetical protein